MSHKSLHVYISSVIVAGVLLRTWQVVFNRCLWLDEAKLALQIIHRSYADFFIPSTYTTNVIVNPALDPAGFLNWAQWQTASPLFLIFSKLMVAWLGVSEYVFRLLPFFAGVCSLILFYFLAKRYVQGAGLFIGVLLFSVSNKLIYYSAELKQYSVDVLAYLTIALFTLRYLERGTRQRWLVLLSAGMLTPWFSHAALFVLPVAGLYCLFAGERALWRSRLAAMWPVGLAWVASIDLLYVCSMQSARSAKGLVEFHAASFMPISLELFSWLVGNFRQMLFDPLSLSRPGAWFLEIVPAGLILLGILKSFRVRGSALLWGPILLALAVSALKAYPFHTRLILYLTPAFYLFLAIGLERIFSAVKIKSRRLSMLLTFGLSLSILAYPVAYSSYRVVHPYDREDVRSAMNFISEHWNGGDLLVLDRHGREPFIFYNLDRWNEQNVVLLDLDIHQELLKVPATNDTGAVWVMRVYSDQSERKSTYEDVMKLGCFAHEVSFSGSHVFRAENAEHQ